MKRQLKACIDLGTLSLKTFYATNETQGFDFSPPFVRKLSESRYGIELDKAVGAGSVLLSYRYGGEIFYRQAGMIAHTGGDLMTQKQKAEDATARILTILGRIVYDKVGLKAGDEIDIDLVLMLPLDEFSTRQGLAKTLREAIAEFSYNGSKVDGVNLSTIKIFVEGQGLSYICVDPNDDDPALRQTVGVLMIGHGDLVWLRFEGGPSKIKAGFGMTRYMMSFREYWPFDDEYLASKNLASGNLKFFLKSPANSEELISLKAAIASAKIDYMNELDICSLPFADATHYILGGGGSTFLKTHLVAALPRSLTRLELKPVKTAIASWFPEMDQAIAPLFMDCFMNFIRMVPRTPKVEPEEWPMPEEVSPNATRH
jgi:hypothetical protein